MTRSRPHPATDPAEFSGGGRPPGLAAAPVLATPRRRRRPALLALAVVLVVVGALGASVVATSLARTTPVIALARAVPEGRQLTAADLVAARIVADPALAPIAYADREEVIGLLAAVELRPGSLLTRDGVTAERFPPPGRQLVGVGVRPGQAPGTPLEAGDAVLLVPLAADGAPAAGAPAGISATEAPPGAVAATVARAGQPGVDGLRVVDVLVDAADGPAVAARAAAGLLAIVVVPSE